MTQLLTTAPVPEYPRNLVHPLRTWLERLGFAVQHDETDELTQLHGTWAVGPGPQFTFRYLHHHPAGQPHTALASLHWLPVGAEAPAQCLVAATHIRRASEARLLVLANHYFKQAQQAASLPQPA